MNPYLREFEVLLPHYPHDAELDPDYDGRWHPNVYDRVLAGLNHA